MTIGKEQDLSKKVYSAKDYVQDGLIANWDVKTSTTDVNSYLATKLHDISEARTKRELTMVFSTQKTSTYTVCPDVLPKIEDTIFGHVSTDITNMRYLVYCGDSRGLAIKANPMTNYNFITLVIGDPNKESWTCYIANEESTSLQFATRSSITKNTTWEISRFMIDPKFSGVNQVLIYGKALTKDDVFWNWKVDKERFGL